MQRIADNLYQGSIHGLQDGTITKDLVTATLAVGNSKCVVDGVQSHHIPLIEFSPDWKVIKEHRIFMRLSSDQEVIAAIELCTRLLESGHVVYLHCDAGICRSVGIAGGYLVRSGKAETIEQAYAQMEVHHIDFTHNPFEITLKKVCESLYWLGVEEYRDFLNPIKNKAGIWI